MRNSLVALFTCLIVGGIAAEPPAELPSKFDPQGPPLWVSAERARGSNQELDRKLFRERDLSMLMSVPPDPSDHLVQGVPGRVPEIACSIFFTGPDDTGHKPHETLEDLVRESVVVVAGEVAEVSQGFFDGVPASLLTLQEPEILKASEEYSLGTVYVRYPFAAFRVGDRSFCTSDPRYPHQPVPGDRLVVFGYFPPRNLERNVLEPFEFGLVIEPAQGPLKLPIPLEAKRGEVEGVSGIKKLVGQALRKGE